MDGNPYIRCFRVPRLSRTIMARLLCLSGVKVRTSFVVQEQPRLVSKGRRDTELTGFQRFCMNGIDLDGLAAFLWKATAHCPVRGSPPKKLRDTSALRPRHCEAI